MKILVLVTLFALANSQGPDPRCPSGTPNPPLHLNDPNDCTRFFTCVGGNAIPTDCPSGQHWSSSANACDWPERAQCVPGVSCPRDNPTWPQQPPMFPHPTDCTRFLKCNWGVAMELECPPGQHWSVSHNWCDWPDRANCQLGSTTRAGSTTSTRSTSSTRSTTTRTTTTPRSTTTRTTTTRRS